MDSIVRAAVVYLFLLVLSRISGKRTMAQLTTFDLVLLLILSEAIQQALIADDNSVTNAFIVVTTLVGLDILMSWLKTRSDSVDALLDGLPMIILEEGRLLRDRMLKDRVDEADILAAARKYHGIERLDQIKFAVLEANGDITVVPREAARP